MKKAYKRPVMVCEKFVTNAYCGACTDNPQLNGVLTVDPSAWTSEPNGSGWKNNPFYGITEGTHTFSKANRTYFITADADGKEYTHYYWTCDANDGYYLEYSAGMSETYGASKFILYKESTNDTDLDVGWGSSFPTKAADGTDTAVAWATFSEGVIANS